MSLPDFEYLGPYRVERTLGRGGMGTVYKGIHAKSGEPVAIKVIATGVANQVRFRRRFASEVETLKRLKHPNIVSLVGYGEEHGLLFYSMEYVDGHSLHQYLRQHARLPWEDVVEIGIQTTAALKHAHDLGIIHRDLKPANLMLNKQGKLKLTDFGIAKLFGSTDMTAIGSVIGTADYMPPEQAEGRGVTARSDLYSLGGVMYALLAGDPPFGGKSVPEVLHAVRYNPVPNLSKLVPDAPEELCRLIVQMLDKNPENRPPTALVVGNRLKALQQGMKKQASLLERAELPASKSPSDTIGTELTSLDLSDVDDEELKLTNPDHSAGTNDRNEEPDDTSSSNAIPTHEQQTMLAPRKPEHGTGEAASGETGVRAEEDEEFTSHLAGQAGLSKGSVHESEFSHADQEQPALSSSIEGPITSGGPSHFTPVSEDDTRSYSFAIGNESETDGFDWIHYGSIAGISLLFLASIGFGWWMIQPRSADELYATIMVAVDTGDDGQLLGAKDEIDDFLTRFPEDVRRSEVESIADDIELTRWSRVLQRRASREGGQDELSAIEQGFLDCMQARSQDFELASTKLAAFIHVFDPIENLTRNERRLVELAKYAAATGAKPDHRSSPALAQLENLIRSAEKTLSDTKLREYYEGLLLLYGDKPWAEPQINRIREKLEAES